MSETQIMSAKITDPVSKIDITIEDLPPPSSLDLPSNTAPLGGNDHGQLPHLPSVNGGNFDRMVISPLPPPLPIDTYSLQYGPVSGTEPQLDSPRHSPVRDGEIPKFDEINDQYEFLRRTLSHSRRRYSARFKRPRARPQSNDSERNENEDEDQSSLDLPKRRRDPVDRSPARVRSPNSHQLHQHQNPKSHTVRGIHPQKDLIRDRRGHQKHHNRTSSPAEIRRETHIDHVGRRYVLDHSTHTVSYEQTEEGVENVPDVRARREMLNRRYQSLHRSFRSAHRERRDPSSGLTTNLSPVESVGAISYIPIDANRRGSSPRGSLDNTSDDASGTSPSSGTGYRNKKGKKSNKSGWFTFGRKSRTVVSESPSTSDSQDDSIPISGQIINHDMLFSPISPPPSLEELGISLPPPLEITTNHEGEIGRERRLDFPEESGLLVGGLEIDIDRETDSDAHTSVTTSAILAAINSEPHPQSRVNGDGNKMGIETQNQRFSHVTDLDRAAAVIAQKKLRSNARRSSSQDQEGEDTDDETNVSPRSTSVTPVDMSHDQEQLSPDQEEEKDIDSKKGKFSRKLSKGLMECPALNFITRRDLYTFLSAAGKDGEAFFSNRALMELVQRIRAENNLFEKLTKRDLYQHSRQLVKALNRFANDSLELPDGWERKLNRQGRVFFIDHTHRITTFIDPRLPLDSINQDETSPSAIHNQTSVRRVYSTSDERELRSHHSTVIHSQSVPNTSPQQVTNTDTTDDSEPSYEFQLVAFFRQPDVIDKINRRYRRGVRPQLREALDDIKANGISGLERVQLSGGTAAYELALILSIFEEEINSIQPQTNPAPQIVAINDPVESRREDGVSTIQRQKQAFSAKLQSFKLQLARLGFAQSSRLKFNIRRDHLLEDAYEHVLKSEIRQLQRKRLNIAFRGEDGLDYGGPSREFFFLVSREIFNPYYGLFEYAANDTYTVQTSSTSSFIQNNLDWFRFAGRIIGLVIAQGFLLDAFFTRPFYKTLLGRPPTLKDLESLEPAFYNSLLWIKDNDPEPLDLTFTVEEEAFGQLTTHELKEGGSDIPVMEENKQEYIDLMVRWRLDRGAHEQIKALMKGFNEIMPISLVQPFDAQELEFIIAGTLEIDVDDWKNHTEYRNGYHATHPVIVWFWQAVEMFDNEQRLRLLQFVTGTSSVPYEGFKALRGSSGPKRFTIDYFNEIRSLPRSHTCFNRLDLPPYPSFQILYEKLRVAVEEGGTFGIE